MQTIVHAYHFDISKPAEKAAWEELRAVLSVGHPHRMKSHGGERLHYQTGQALDGKAIELETAHLFSNQWNSAPIEGFSTIGYRLFDWAQDSLWYKGRENRIIKQGYYLEQTDEMREVRANTMACGYCGKQEPAAKGSVFCPQCLDSAYLKQEDLPMLRMRPTNVDRFAEPLPPLTKAESDYLLPLYKEAQTKGNTERGKARIAKAKASIETEYQASIRNATEKRDAANWIMGIIPGQLDNWIFYTHTGRHAFGWRTALGQVQLDAILEVISEFPFSYDLICADGRKLSGN